MRLVCPSCAAAYDVPDSLLAAGRIVRCARCSHEWTPVEALAELVEPAPEPAPLPPPPALMPAPEAIDRLMIPRAADSPGGRQSAMDWLAAHPVAIKSRLPLRIAWAASLIVLATAVWSAYAWRSQIMEAWPPSQRAYAAIGLRPGPAGSGGFAP